jgi:transcriptional regulator with XRE-family HTH domain
MLASAGEQRKRFFSLHPRRVLAKVLAMNMLDTYLRAPGAKSAREIARDAGVSSPYVTDLRYGRRRPSAAVAEAIEIATNRAVPAQSWFDAGETAHGGRP